MESLFASNNPRQAKVGYFGVHLLVKNIAGFQISMNDPQSGVLMKIKKPSSYSYNDVKACLPVQNQALCVILQFSYQNIL
ncbi:LOW QUALITY PROTEIN: hypothetical protein TorRG33x02_339870 [Trema orientale]|uniref:Uncharacterized protein n=1 Tax=Trema orientale TaxID=63057 RepID=A0A2P5AVZ7_TREOI|nr:LOW QUALITY PROTEIN: hypothetical protein TorRG33x02_339870 [Trema orientale]